MSNQMELNEKSQLLDSETTEVIEDSPQFTKTHRKKFSMKYCFFKMILPFILLLFIIILVSVTIIVLIFVFQVSKSPTPFCNVSEYTTQILTYPFSHPTPLPSLFRDVRIFPYSFFLKYETEGEYRDYKVVKLENEYISVYILPEVGGKVWYAESKKDNREFIYKNDVLKYRHIGIRGPWTSGGIEFNFGVIGHTPSATFNVSYTNKNNENSCSCIVGSFDLPSRTFWRVEVKLEVGSANFQTIPVWYNPTPIRQAYYSWMNGATKTEDDLQFFYPGEKFLSHNGRCSDWPIDSQGRDLSHYNENDFGGSKTYHIVGDYNNFFAAYYNEKEFGVGHWAEYSDMPGRKVFLWALSGDGQIWEKLLTDTNGQYMEIQSGRMFLQYVPNKSQQNPMRKAFFDPYMTETWIDVWAPIEGIGGISDMSKIGAIYVKFSDDKTLLTVAVSAFESVSEAKLKVKQQGEVIYEHKLDLAPLEIFMGDVTCNPNIGVEVEIDKMSLYWSNEPDKSREISRPFETDLSETIPEVEQLLIEGKDSMAGRYYEEAIQAFDAILEINPWNKEALILRAELYYRSGLYDKGLELVNKTLEIDSPFPEGNYIAGILYRAKGDLLNSDECFGWAARSSSFRSSSLAQKAELELFRGKTERAIRFATSSLDYNRFNVPALQTLAMAARIEGDRKKAKDVLGMLFEIDPLHHFGRFEEYLLNLNTLENFEQLIGCEFPEHIYLELALLYNRHGFVDDALFLLGLGNKRTDCPILELWIAYLNRMTFTDTLKCVSEDHLQRANRNSLVGDLVYPYRRESIEMLEWVIETEENWVWKYLLAVLYWTKQRRAEACEILSGLGDIPNQGYFYSSRAYFLKQEWSVDEEEDLLKSISFGSTDFDIWMQLILYYQGKERWIDSLEQSREAYKTYPNIPDVALAHVRSLLHRNQSEDAVEVMRSTFVLPSENGKDSRSLWEWTYILNAVHKIISSSYNATLEILQEGSEWPENVGVGRPYFPDQRMFDFLIAFCYKNLGDVEKMTSYYEKVIEFTFDYSVPNLMQTYSGVSRMEDYYGYMALINLGEVQRADDLITDLAKSSNIYLQWVVACAQKDLEKLSALKQQHPSIFQGFPFLLLEDTLRAIFNSQTEEICSAF